MPDIPIITLDGPSGAGKGTVAARLAQHYGWHILDSGALYRLVGYAASQAGTDLADGEALVSVVGGMQVQFAPNQVTLNGEDVTLAIRTETAGNAASKVAAMPAVRAALLDWQRGYAKRPGLVADGRDMGTVVFPQARLKVFLTASADERALRRYKQLKEKGITARVATLAAEIRERDERDQNRAAAPLKPAEGALRIDSTSMSIDDVAHSIIRAAKSRLS